MNLKFIKKSFDAVTGDSSAKQYSSNNQGTIVFDPSHNIICVDGVSYGGNIRNAVFANSILTLTTQDDQEITVNFSDMASADAITGVFNELYNKIGLDDNGAVSYSDTNYLSGESSLVDADKTLDAQIKTIENSVNNIEVKVGGTNIMTGGVADIGVEGDYDSTYNRIVTQSVVSEAISDSLDNLSTEIEIGIQNGNSVTIVSHIRQSDGLIQNNYHGTPSITLADIAATGQAADVAIADENGNFTAENVEGALEELAQQIEDNEVTVATGEKVISMSSDNELSTTLTLTVEQQGETGNEKDYIVLKGIGGAEITKIDATRFLKDGMLSNAELVSTAEEGITTEAPYIKLTFNTDSGKETIRFSVSSLVDTYTSGDTVALTVNNYTITPNTGAVAEGAGTLTTGGQVYTAIQNAAAVVNADATIVANDSTSTEIATIGGTSVTAKVKLLWDEWEVPAPQGPNEPFYVYNNSDTVQTLSLTPRNSLVETNFSSTGVSNDKKYYNTVFTSTDGSNWSEGQVLSNTLSLSFEVQPHQKLYIAGAGGNFLTANEQGLAWNSTISGINTIGGNILSLLYGTLFDGQTTYRTDYSKASGGQFRGFSTDSIIDASELLLPDEAHEYSFSAMFSNCTNLINPPKIPASTSYYSHSNMFSNCTSLTKAPELPATTLANSCYSSMFNGCTSLTTAPELPATTMTDSCYASMFYNCTSLTKAPELPATKLYDFCYNAMFYHCTSLTEAPDLLVTKLDSTECYSSMFNGCTLLTKIKCLASNSKSSYTNSWLANVSTSGTFIKASGANWESGNSGIPTGWTVQEV